MKKKTAIILVFLALAAAAAAYFGVRVSRHGRDIIGVTTLPDKKNVIMNSAAGNEFVSGTGTLTVGEGEHLHLSYKLSSGSFDIAFDPGRDEIQTAIENQDFESLPGPEEGQTEHFIEKMNLEGKDQLDFEVEAGNYTVEFTIHGAVGNATITSVRK